MAEVTGIGPTDPEGVGDDSVNAIKGISQLLDYMEDSLEVQDEILEVIKQIKDQRDPTKTGGASRDPLIESLDENTSAIEGLTTKLDSITVDIAFHGMNSKFFEKLVNVASDPSKVKALEMVADVFESMGKRLSQMGKYSDGIDKFSASMYGLFGSVKELGKGMMMFSGGLALLGFTLITFMDAITVEDLAKFAGIMLVVAGAARLVGKGGSWNLAKASVGIATLGLAIWAFNELITTEVALDFVFSMGLISMGIGIMGLVGKKMGGGSVGSLIKASVGIAAIAGSIYLLNQAISGLEDFDLMVAGKLAIVAGTFGLVYNFLGKAVAPIIKGSVAAAAIGGSLWILGAGIGSLSEIDLTLGRGLELAGIVVAAAGILTLIGNPVTIGFTLAGAAGAAAIGAALMVLSLGVNSIGNVNISESQAQNFSNSLGHAVDAMVSLASPLTAAALLVATPVAVALSASTLAVSAAMFAVGKLPSISNDKWDSFKYGIQTLGDSYGGFGLLEIASMTAGSTVMALVAGTSIMTASAIWAFSKLSAKPENVDNAVRSLDTFITGISTTFDNNKGKFKSIRFGANSFFGLSSMAGEIADTVQRISSMEFVEKKVVNGKVVTTGVRKFTPADFKAVGNNIGQILNALTDPLAQIGSSQDSFSIGGWKITNPFSNKVQDGIEAMAGIGSVFSPIAEILNSFVNGNINSTFVGTFNKNLAGIIGGIGNAFSDSNVELDKNKASQIIRASGSIKGLLKTITVDGFGKGVEEFGQFSGDLNQVSKAINEINVEKLSSFNSMLAHMNELGKNDAIKELVTVFTEFIERLARLEALRQAPQVQEGPVSPIIVDQKQQPISKNQQQITQDPKELEALLVGANDEIVEAITQLYEFLAAGNLKVKTNNLDF
jgi:hypothetical protein